MKSIYDTAYVWWKSFRPVSWTELAHIENPTINMTSGRSGEKELAKLVAKRVKARYNKDGTKKRGVK